ncbi:hypothetical protein BGZ95_003863 [Linnemannia exigua]|uniref:F-box domain-containing protein n=1 Tax=Linnemannia exigua TaxID=604196 RepID=A0AAD4DHP3_9FUNG|nr:hypothetical protein BGZ95_003863 [Linnemannia exigua]
MTTSSHATVFDIHLLQEQICSHLSLRDIRRCCLVSKDFYHNFTPFLYRNILIHRKSTYNKFHTPESLAALAKHRDQVTHVNCVFAQIWKTLLDCGCHNLVGLTSGHLPKRDSNRDQNRFQTRYITDLIEANPRLYTVELSQFLFEPEVVARFCSVLRNHTQLRELSILCPKSNLSWKLINLLTWSSFHLEKLHIALDTYFRRGGERPRGELQGCESLASSKEPDFALKELALTFRVPSHQTKSLFRLLGCTPHVERFVAPAIDDDGSMNGLISLMQTTMTNIQHLNVHSLWVQGDPVVRLVSLCRNLKSFVSSPIQRGIHLVADALLLHHRDTLEELHMVRAARITTQQVLAFLEECPKLRIVDMMVTMEKSSPDQEVMTRQRIGDAIVSTGEMDATCGISWACTGLRVLKLRYAVPERGQDEENQEVDESDEWVLPSVLYNRIAELTQLETLWLGKVEPPIVADDSFMLAIHVGRGQIPPELRPPPPPTSESEIRQRKIGTLNMSKALLAWRSLPRLRQLHLRGLKNFIDKDTVREARKSWMELEWICYR